MMKLNPMVYNILEHYKIKPYIDTGILKDLVIVNMNESISALNTYKENGAPADKVDNYIAQISVLRDYIYFRLARLF